MPRIKRWFPVSHDINRDPEIVQLCRKFGLTGLRCWLEILSIADRNDGVLPGRWDDYPRILAGAIQSQSKHVRPVCDWLSLSGVTPGHSPVRPWVTVGSQGGSIVTNYWKYHRTEERNPVPSEPDLTRPDLRSSFYKNKKKQDPASPAPSAVLSATPISNNGKGKAGMGRTMHLSPELKEQTDRLYFSDREKYKRVAAWVAEGRAEEFSESDMAETLRQFWPVRDEVEDFWPWCDRVIEAMVEEREREEKRLEFEREEREHERRKAAERDFAREWNLAKGIGDAEKKP